MQSLWRKSEHSNTVCNSVTECSTCSQPEIHTSYVALQSTSSDTQQHASPSAQSAFHIRRINKISTKRCLFSTKKETKIITHSLLKTWFSTENLNENIQSLVKVHLEIYKAINVNFSTMFTRFVNKTAWCHCWTVKKFNSTESVTRYHKHWHSTHKQKLLKRSWNKLNIKLNRWLVRS